MTGVWVVFVGGWRAIGEFSTQSEAEAAAKECISRDVEVRRMA